MRHLTILLFMTFVLFSQEISSSFKDYKKVSLEDNHDFIAIYLSPKLSKSVKIIKNKYMDNLAEESKNAIEVKFKNKTLRISISEGYSYDPNVVFRFKNVEDEVIVYCDDKIFISDSGFVYSINRMNDIYTTHRKYQLSEKNVTEIKQPFHKMDIACKTSALTKLYSQKYQKGHVIASISKGRMLKILLADMSKGTSRTMEEREYLVETSFGLVGWVTSTSGYNQVIGNPLSCLMLYGD